MTGHNHEPDNNISDLGAALRAEVPSERPTFWAEVDARFATAGREAEAPTPIDASSRPGETPVSNNGSGRRTLASWPLLVASAALVVVGLFVGNQLIASNDEVVETGFAHDENPVETAELPGPVQNFDHWHAVYGVWDCTANVGAGDWVPAFESDRDDTGIHSHQDGLIHIHPFFERSAGQNARIGLWADEMGVTISDDAITLDTGRVLREGQTCGPADGEPAVVHIRRWVLDLQVLADPILPPTVVTSNLVNERFYNDREVWIIAYAPLDAEIPLPPRDRFDQLVRVTATFDSSNLPAVIAPGIRLGDQALPPAPAVTFDAQSTIRDQLRQLVAIVNSVDASDVTVPEADGYGQLAPLPGGDLARGNLEALLPEAGQQPGPGPGALIGAPIFGEIRHFGAASSEGRPNDLYLYQVSTDDIPGGVADCSAVVDTSRPFGFPMVSCTSPGGGFGWGSVFGTDDSERWGYAVLTGIDPAGVWFSIELDDGRDVIANTLDGSAFLSWDGDAKVDRATVLDIDLNEIWTEAGTG